MSIHYDLLLKSSSTRALDRPDARGIQREQPTLARGSASEAGRFGQSGGSQGSCFVNGRSTRRQILGNVGQEVLMRALSQGLWKSCACLPWDSTPDV